MLESLLNDKSMNEKHELLEPKIRVYKNHIVTITFVWCVCSVYVDVHGYTCMRGMHACACVPVEARCWPQASCVAPHLIF